MTGNTSELLETVSTLAATQDTSGLDALKAKYEQQVKLSPLNCEAQFNLANICLKSGDKEKAQRLYQFVRKLDPKHKLVRKKLIELLLAARKPRDAGPIAAELIAIDDDDADSIKILASVEFAIGNWDNVVANCDAAIAASDDKAAMRSAVLPYYIHCAELADAESMLRQVLRANPDDKVAMRATGSLYYRKGEFDAGISHLQNALEKNPDNDQLNFGLCFHQLASGDLRNGWTEFTRRSLKDFFKNEKNPPRANNVDDLRGKSVFVVAEQGIGDVFQFLRFLPQVCEVASEVHLNIRESLYDIVRPAFPDVSLHSNLNDARACDIALPLMDVPRVLKYFSHQDMASPPYLRAEQARVKKWRNVIGDHGFKVGICWQGNPLGLVDLGRSVPLVECKPISEIDGVRLISLQHGFGEEQIADNPDMNIEVLSDVDADEGSAFLDTAAIMNCLDLIVTTDTSTAHLAGALGCPGLVLLKKYPDWRWILGGNGDVWYENLQRLNQEDIGDWAGVLRNVVKEIERRKSYG